MTSASDAIPIIDVAPLLSSGGDRASVARAIARACQDDGFFYLVGHGVAEQLGTGLEARSREFFAQDLATKRTISLARGGRAWRGYFAVGEELTLDLPDQKEGLYFGAELPDDDPRVQARVPLHGRNLFPDLPGFRESVLAYMEALTALGHVVMEGVALSLGLPAAYFAERYTGDPLILFRIFNYPALTDNVTGRSVWSVGEHTDYGLLTLLRQDDARGLQVRSRKGWIEAPPIPGSLVCNIGDMLDRLTGGRYRSTPHRVRNVSGRDRLSFPFFFDPGFSVKVQPIFPSAPLLDDKDSRWDRTSVHELHGTYGEYLMRKVSRVFPELGRDVL